MFNRVQSTQDEKARFIKGNELKLSYFHCFFLREQFELSKRYYVFSYETGVKKKKKHKSCTSHRLRNTFQHAEDIVAIELFHYLLLPETYNDAFIRLVYVYKGLQKCNSKNI